MFNELIASSWQKNDRASAGAAKALHDAAMEKSFQKRQERKQRQRYYPLNAPMKLCDKNYFV